MPELGSLVLCISVTTSVLRTLDPSWRKVGIWSLPPFNNPSRIQTFSSLLQQLSKASMLWSFVTAPQHLIFGDITERRQQVKEIWLWQMGNCCRWCLAMLEYREVWVSTGQNADTMVMKPNLHAHHCDDRGYVSGADRLGNLYVPAASRPARQRRVLQVFAHNLCGCILLCDSCHGAYHRNESVIARHRGVFQLTCNRLCDS